MSSIDKIKESSDFKLDTVRARAEAMHAVLEGSKAQMDERIARHKDDARREIMKLAAQVENHNDLSTARKQAVRSVVENLDQQIALAQSASTETLASARRQIQDAIGRIERELDAALASMQTAGGELLHASIDTSARAMARLDAELEAAEQRLASSRSQADDAFKKGCRELSEDLTTLKRQLGEKTTRTRDELGTLEQELSGGFEQLAKKFRDLWG
jgi:hypothetical protein